MRILPLLLFSGILCAQDHPQFVWQGDVDGIAILHMRDNRLDIQIQEGAPVARQRFQFSERLPEIHQQARLEVREGRGYVHIIDQPRLDNHYTLSVSIEDRQPGASFYSIALYWDASSRFYEGAHHPGRSDQVAWSGRVDEEAIVSCQAKTCVSSADRGAPVASERSKFSRPLPKRDLDVSLGEALGRGQIRLVEQPRQRNNYTARVAIRDPQEGSGEYSFTLIWARDAAKPGEPMQPTRGLFWTGAVDGRVRITVLGGSALSEVVQGRPIIGEHAEFLRPLPSRADLNPAVQKLRGPGRVAIVEFPSQKNNYRLVFEIDGSESGAGDYEIEVDW